MGITRNNFPADTITEHYFTSPIKSAATSRREPLITLTYRDGRTVTHAFPTDHGMVRLPSYDGRRFYCTSETADCLTCYDTETFGKNG